MQLGKSQKAIEFVSAKSLVADTYPWRMLDWFQCEQHLPHTSCTIYCQKVANHPKEGLLDQALAQAPYTPPLLVSFV